jgi:transposase InsO family protein
LNARHADPEPPTTTLSVGSSPTHPEPHEDDEFVTLDTALLATDSAIKVLSATGRVLVDCGSTHNFIRTRFADKHSFPRVRTGSKITVQYADSKATVEDMIKVPNAAVEFLDTKGAAVSTTMSFFLASSLTEYDVVIGKQGLAQLSRHYGLHTDFAANTMTIRQSPLATPVAIVLRAQGARKMHVNLASVMARHVEFLSPDAAQGSPEAVMEAETHKSYSDLWEPVTGHNPSTLPTEVRMKFRTPPAPSTPIRYATSPDDQIILSEIVADLLSRGIIEPCNSRYSSPAFLVRKEGLDDKGRPRKRLVIDLRRINDALHDQPPPFPTPKAEELARALSSFEYFSVVDLRDGYYMTQIAPEDRDYCSFSCALGTFRFRRSPMGLKLSAAAFQSNVAHVLRSIQLQFPGQVHVFVDDLTIAANSLEENKKILHLVLDQLRAFNIKANGTKLQLFRREVRFLGYTIKRGSFSLQERANKAGDIPTPTSKKQLRAFTGFLAYFRAHIPRLAERAAPLYRMQGKDVKFTWGAEQDQAFHDLKTQLAHLHDLVPPSTGTPDYVLYCDASQGGVAGHLCEDRSGNLQPIGFFSEALPAGGSTWSVEERELLAIVRSLNHFEHLTAGSKIRVLSDCRPLVLALRRDRIESDRARRLVAKFLDHDVTVEHHDGASNPADFGSRQFAPPPTSESWAPSRIMVNARRAQRTAEMDQTARAAQLLISVGPDRGEWRKAYEEDPVTADIIRILQDTSTGGHPWREKYEMHEDMLYLKSDGLGDRRVYVPNSHDLRQRVLTACHDDPSAGHGGVSKTTHRIASRYFWPDIRNTVKLYVASCVPCARAKPMTLHPGPPRPLEVPTEPFSAIAIDLVTALPAAQAHFEGRVQEVTCVLTVADLLTHFVMFFAVPKTITGEQVAKVLIDQVFTAQCKVPDKIVSDRDPRWTSALVRGICNDLGIRLALTCAHSPRGNGLVEAKNKHLGTYLKTMGARAKDWPSLLSSCALAYNSAFCQSIGMTPAEARFGLKPEFPFGIEQTGATLAAPLKALQKAQEMALTGAKDALRAAGDVTIRGQGQGRIPRPLEVGGMVMVSATALLPPSKHAGINRKVAARFLGPYRILRKISPEAFEIDLPPTSRAHRTISIRFLKPIVSTDKFPTRPQPNTDLQEQHMDYIVDKILDHRKRKRKLQFLVKWHGYTSDEATWEPIEHFMDDGHVTNDALSQYMYDLDMLIP